MPSSGQPLSADHESLLKVAGEMSPDLRAWIDEHPGLLAVRPQLTP